MPESKETKEERKKKLQKLAKKKSKEERKKKLQKSKETEEEPKAKKQRAAVSSAELKGLGDIQILAPRVRKSVQ
jgi:GTPase SAR1 family protein